MTATATQTCSCTEKKSDGMRDRCATGERLWEELIEARDALREGQGDRTGRKQLIDEFAARRDAYQDHVREGQS